MTASHTQTTDCRPHLMPTADEGVTVRSPLRPDARGYDLDTTPTAQRSPLPSVLPSNTSRKALLEVKPAENLVEK